MFMLIGHLNKLQIKNLLPVPQKESVNLTEMLSLGPAGIVRTLTLPWDMMCAELQPQSKGSFITSLT